MVVDDVRLPNEVEAVRRLGGVVIQLVAPVDLALASPSAGHVSEHGGLDVDADLTNCRGPGFFATLDHMLRRQRFRSPELPNFAGAQR